MTRAAEAVREDVRPDKERPIWNRDDLAVLRKELARIGARVAVESSFWKSKAADRPKLVAMRLIVEAYSGAAADWRRLTLRVAPASLAFGAAAAERPFGWAAPWGAQASLAVLLAVFLLAWAWESEIRSRLGLSRRLAARRRLARVLAVGGFVLIVVSGLSFSVFFATALLPSLGFTNTETVDLLIVAAAIAGAGLLLLHTTTIAADDGRSPLEAWRFIKADCLQFVFGAAATLPPFVAGVLSLAACLVGSLQTAGYNFAAAGALGVLILGGIIHAGYLGRVRATLA